eukprot:Gregarina_sp_Poly_1__3158@NODE_1896_length_3125_cov_46_009810_g1228_i0_p1_GENE_NODE_1896_length_3125_cov_46_009810_g1228_i0NODE_1896_length_3125_cov_46_009810_g1228_i0_p1_ORF_typecomplete_len933_score141_07DUF4421/PF14391_6/1_2e02DUF4421/PF14391_6/0_17_NODE_1896_length_3125_cov_46_009810_g1228_i01942992
MYRQVRPSFFSPKGCCKKQFSHFCFLELILNPLLQTPVTLDSMISILSEKFSANLRKSADDKYEFRNWDRLKNAIVPPHIETFKDCLKTQPASHIFWRCLNVPSAKDASKEAFIDSDILNLLKSWSRDLKPEPSEKWSLLLAILAESVFYTRHHTPNLERFFQIFKKQGTLMKWFSHRKDEPLARKIIYRYFVLESLRLSPELLEIVSKKEGGESTDSVTNLIKDLLNLWSAENSLTFESEPLEEYEVSDKQSDDFQSPEFLKLFGTLEGPGDSCAKVWNGIKGDSVRSLPLYEGATVQDNLADIYFGFNLWRKFVVERHSEDKSHYAEVFKLVPHLIPLMKSNSLSNGSSLVIALLSETISGRFSAHPEIQLWASLLRPYSYFTSWLNEKYQNVSAKNMSCTRIAFRYYYLERLRQSPTLRRMISKHYEWESQNPEKDIWDTFRKKLDTLSLRFTDIGIFNNMEFSHKASSLRTSLARLKFLYALMARLNPDESNGVSQDTWIKILVLDPIFLGAANIEGGNSVEWEQGLRHSWQAYCEHLGIPAGSQQDAPQTSQKSNGNNNNEEPDNLLLEAVFGVLAEANSGWKSSEWLLVLSVLSICRWKDPKWTELENLESKILANKSVLGRVLFRYFVLEYARKNDIPSLGSDCQLRFWESCEMKKVCERHPIREIELGCTQRTLTLRQFERIQEKMRRSLHTYRFGESGSLMGTWVWVEKFIGTILASPNTQLYNSHSSDASDNLDVSSTRLKFVFALMGYLNLEERTAITPDTWKKIMLMNSTSLDVANAGIESSMELEKYFEQLWKEFCVYLGISSCCPSDTPPGTQQTSIPSQRPNNNFLLKAAFEMLVEASKSWEPREANNGRESPEWLLVLSVLSIYDWDDPTWKVLDHFEAKIFTRKTILERQHLWPFTDPDKGWNVEILSSPLLQRR